MKSHPVFLILRAQFWFIPGVYGLMSILFAIFSIYLDFTFHFNWLPNALLVNLALAQTLLSTIVSSLLTMTTISFSTIMVVLTTYLSQFSPRTMQDFITDVYTQRILGVFIGGFVYSLVLLLLLRDSNHEQLFISPTVAVLYAIICVGYFVFFVHHVGRWIQVSNLIHHITRSTIESIHENYEEAEDQPADEPWKDWESEDVKLVDPYHIHSYVSGYLLVVELDELIKQAKDDDVIVKIEVGVGDYIEVGTIILSIWGERDKIDPSDYVKKLHVAEERATIQDIDFGLTKLVEISLRALSPGINDPNTAISGIRALARILTVLARKNLHRSYYNDSYQSLRVIVKQRQFKDYLYKCYYQIRQPGTEDVSVLAAIIDSLQTIAAQNDQQVKETIWEFSKYIQEGIKKEEMLDLDRTYLNEKLQKLAIQTNQGSHFIPM
ncbi:DUF2254 domain-containing protein [Halalkalibacter krulwichiae]|uniref:DUF2254 domain-containing protein n=1 Tax=Halalkalibacter krulwichiae TaxID=199441 RepID=A0A1X9MIL9_9BACI|nr:DUF2254 domain-containing protein [Halalkalibacter krulwichiae]ARK30452.1 hypothetical protein BkAM31D_11785 [Halalkalibacter krulwichiae]